MSDYGEDEAIAWQAEGEPDMVRVQRERAEKAEAEVARLREMLHVAYRRSGQAWNWPEDEWRESLKKVRGQ